ncbi:MAG: redoxin domain-containing protein [Saprospiraceae bacterium]|nr:redoxin domain-containing protein [Saprospiraceae bacterium]
MTPLKTKTILFFSLLLISRLTAQTDSTVIDAYIDGLQAGKTKLVGMFGDQNYIADSAVVDPNGHFTLRRKSPLPAGLYTFLLPGSKNLSILIDKDDQILTLRANVSDMLGSMKVEGSLNTDLFYQTNKYQSLQDRELGLLAEKMKNLSAASPDYQQAKSRQDELVAERKAYLDGIYKQYPNLFFTKFKYAGQNPEFREMRKPNGDVDTIGQVVSYRNRFWDNVDFNDPRLLYTPVISNKLKRYIKDLTPQQPDSLIKVSDALIRRVMIYPEYFKFFSNWIALQYENTKTTVMDGEAVFVHIINNFFTEELATWEKPENIKKLRQHVWEMQASLMGKKGPDVIAPDVNGQMRSIYEKTAPLVVIFMFNPDCEHCQKESAEVEAIYKKWKDKGVDFYGIAVNTTDAEWKEFVQKQGFTFTNVFDPTNKAIYAKYYVDITPELYLLNKDRTIVAKNLHANQLEQMFEKEFKKMK